MYATLAASQKHHTEANDSRFHFDDSANAIVVKDPRLPAPWINYLSNGNMHAFVSQTSGGLAWWRSPTEYRLTRYRHYHLPIDSPGFYLTVQDGNSAPWSPAFRPAEVLPQKWECRHMPGVTQFNATQEGLTASVEYYITPDHDALVWDLKLTNDTDTEKELNLYAYIEFSQLLWEPEASWGYYLRHMCRAWLEQDSQSIIYLNHNAGGAGKDGVPLVTFGGTAPLTSWTADRDKYCGAYRTERDPICIERRQLGQENITAGEPCGALHHTIKLAPGESTRLAWFLLAEGKGLTDFKQTTAKLTNTLNTLRDFNTLDAQRAKITKWWDEHLNILQAELDDPATQRQINLWTPVNTVLTGRFSRSINQWAPGIRGVGFRDTVQDMLSIAYRKPQWALDNFNYLLTQQYEDGHAVHTAFPIEKKNPSTSIHSDDHLWLPLLAHAIAAETGDLTFLETQLPWLGDDHRSPSGSATAWEHLLAGVRFTESHLGTHDIPLTLASDWNDIIGKFARKGKGESTFAGMQYLYALRLMIDLAEVTGKTDDKSFLEDCLTRQTKALEKCGWDGKWWLRGFDDDAQPVGSEQSELGKLFINPQSWAILAGLGTAEQQLGSMDEVRSQLLTDCGLKLITPSFVTYPDVSDPFSGYAPGTGENGAIFCHANTWAIIAETILGRGDIAWDYYRRLVPENVIKTVGLDTYQAEAYAWVSNIVGPENKRFGWGNVNQVTGTATWMDVVSTQYLLGIRPTLRGLLIDPCLPSDLKQIKVKRQYRGKQLNIIIENPEGKTTRGLTSLTLNGNALDLADGAVLTDELLKDGDSFEVVAKLG